MNNFYSYNHVLIAAFLDNNKQQEILARKIQLINQVYDHYDFRPTTELFVGFNPAVLTAKPGKAFILGVSSRDYEILQKLGCTAQLINSVADLPVTVDATISGDEFYTFFDDESAQRKFLSELRTATTRVCMTTLRDYKNQDFKEREFSFPALIKNDHGYQIYLEYHDHDPRLKNSWNTMIYAIDNQDTEVYGPFPRRAVFFKQLAKFAADAGFANFLVHKNLMYKSIIRKNYEHVISFS